jgi:hypothetical protein
MGSPLQGIFEAEVLDTSMFNEMGRIRVKLASMSDPELWEYAIVLTPYGGLPNMGVQSLPPVGAWGCVAYLRGDQSYPVWMGSMLRYYQTETGKEMDKKIANPVEATEPTEFVIKTQYTTPENLDIDSDDNKVENILRLNENYFQMTHVQQSDKYNYEKKAYEAEKNKPMNTITIKDNEIRLKVRTKEDDADRFFVVDQGKVRFEYDKDHWIDFDVDRCIIKSGKADIEIKDFGKIIVTADRIELNGNNFWATLYEPIRDFVNQHYNKHIHGTPCGPSSPPKSPFMQATTFKSKHTKLN